MFNCTYCNLVFDEKKIFLAHQKTKKCLNHRQIKFVQDNHSCSKKGVIRGLHYQDSPNQQAKLVRVIAGEIFDVAVDIRPDSKTFGKWVGVNLSAVNKNQLWIPEGFAHGFLSLSDNTQVLYKTTDYYSPKNERCILWNDKNLDIKWPSFDKSFIVSEKDKSGLALFKKKDGVIY